MSWIVLAAVLACPAMARAQIGALVSPGPLSKAHASLEGVSNCVKCHEPGRQVTASRCLACHKPIAERIAARKGVHRDAADQCVACHAEHAGLDAELRPFDPARFDHAGETGFPIDGLHAPLAGQCARCHKTRSFLTARPDCAACHADPHKGSLGAACTRCHSTAVKFTAARSSFDHGRTRFPLVGAHQKVDCARCHTAGTFTGLKFASCTDCHRSPHRAPLGSDCTSCHGNDAWQTRKVDHARTAFPLVGRHASVPCASCHKQSPVKVALKADRCANCHVDVHQGEFKQDCRACHKETGFAAAPFDHAAQTTFALTGRHATLPCGQCHKTASTLSPSRAGQTDRLVLFGGLKRECAACHADVHKGETGPACERCHGTTDFKAVAPYAHAPALAAFFTGGHRALPCAACHGGQARPHVSRTAGQPAGASTVAPAAAIGSWRFKAIGTACAGCHVDAHGGQLGSACETCHRLEDPAFAAGGFSHAKTSFPLTGRHQAVACASCHKPAQAGGPARYRDTPNACASCHRDVHLAQLGDRCETCHSTAGFPIASYTHRGANLASFFVGKHATVPCTGCHRPQEADFPGGHGTAVRYRGMGTACASCHAEEDAHHGALGPSCETCHEPVRWATASRAFHKAGQFPLEGRHLTVPCASCHIAGVTQGTPTQCFDCHWARRQDDRYKLQLGSQCEQCHRPVSWTAVSWNHGARTGYPLNVAHAVLQCDNCHKDGTFAQTRLDCYGCHREDYEGAKNPDHVKAGFPTDCESCHTQTASSWSGGAFNHQSIFPLVGAHATQPCGACHVSGVFRGTPRDCVGCHQDDYQRTQNPNHAAAGFPTTCEVCHSASTSSWAASFNHSVVFPLVGTHATQPCASCHVNNVFRGTPRDCVGCHLADYQGTRDPNHAAAGFPTTCQTCHSAASATWAASFNHNQFFPLVGRHAQQPCAACHANGRYAGTPRDCVGCHRSDYDRTRNPDHRATGFPTTCDSCHRASDGSWSQGRFNHTWFPITSGPHSGHPCSACHTDANNYAVFSCTTCHGRSETDSHHQQVSGYRYDSQACYTCHPTGRSD